MDAAQAMDKMYRYQRHIYDFTRKYYLLGRDKLLHSMAKEVPEHAHVMEVGCGTARNLRKFLKQRPDLNLYGLDASQEMLNTAIAKLNPEEKQKIVLHQGFAQNFHYQDSGQDEAFDAIFFSYSLSMIPVWRESIAVGLDNLKPGGYLYIVDFADQRELPRWFQKILQAWLALFGVHYRAELPDYLRELVQQGKGELVFTPLYKHYAFIAAFKKVSDA